MLEWRAVVGEARRLPGAADGDAYGFEREGRGVVAVNLGDAEATLTVPTTMPAGRYCDVIASGPVREAGCADDALVTVADGSATFVLAGGSAAAIHLAGSEN
jgi:alpha-amylase